MVHHMLLHQTVHFKSNSICINGGDHLKMQVHVKLTGSAEPAPAPTATHALTSAAPEWSQSDWHISDHFLSWPCIMAPA